MNQTISVIIPVFNSEGFIEKCINSIINQSYKSLEIIIINDGSTDGSKGIIDRFVSIDKRIKFFSKGNGGIGSAYKMAFKHVTGDFILFVDSDDFLELETCEELMNVALQENVDMVHFASKVVDVSGQEIEGNAFGGIDEVAESQDQIVSLFVEKLKHPSLINLFKSNLFTDIKIFDQNIGIDEMLTPQLLLKMNKAVYTTKSYCNVVAREDSVSRSVYGEVKLEQLVDVYTFIIDFVRPNSEKLEKYYVEKYWLILLSTIRNHWKNESSFSKPLLKKLYSEYHILFDEAKNTPYYNSLNWVRKLEVYFYNFISFRFK
jgi:glycosyltransferase involved in cell wall biosynthesis